MKKENIKKFRNAEEKIFPDKNTYEGESIEEKTARITENNEPITDGAPLVYTKRSDGVLAQYDVRTDKWDLALEKMQYVNETKKNKIKESMSKQLTKTEEQKQEEQKN